MSRSLKGQPPPPSSSYHFMVRRYGTHSKGKWRWWNIQVALDLDLFVHLRLLDLVCFLVGSQKSDCILYQEAKSHKLRISTKSRLTSTHLLGLSPSDAYLNGPPTKVTLPRLTSPSQVRGHTDHRRVTHDGIEMCGRSSHL